MKKTVLIALLLFLWKFQLQSQIRCPLLISTLTNQNVYKTKDKITLTRVYDLRTGRTIKDTTAYILQPNDTFEIIKYKVVEDGDNPYIRLLPTMQFIRIDPDTIVIQATNTSNTTVDPTDFYFQMKDEPCPNNHYLSTQSITGMPITTPVKIRQLGKEFKIDVDFSLGYAFGYKVKLGNNPYRKKYVNFIPFAFSLNKDKYFNNNNGTYSTEEDAISFTYYSGGITYEYYGLNMGIFAGWDRMFNSQKDWVYQYKNWFSLGIGYKFGKDE